MPEYPPSHQSHHRPVYSLADLTREFITERGWTQCEVARKMQDLKDAMPPDQKGVVSRVSNSCLSRWKTAKDKPVLRHQFIAVAYASAHLDWESSGKAGSEPGLSNVLHMWERRHTPSPFRAEATTQRPNTSPTIEVKPQRRSEADLSDAAQIKALRSYGTAGVNLLTAARAGDKMAALDFGLLRALDGHRREGEGWFRAAHFEGFPSANGAGGKTTVEYGSPLFAVAQAALERASELPDDDSYLERKALLLEKAATHKTPRAAGLLASYFEDQGESGAAARWRIAMKMN